MEDKYYTPSIEEFHVGFEFEYTHKDDWFQNIILDPQEINDFFNDDSIEIRVKYLDNEDIESLGFKYIMTSYDGYYEKKDITLGFAYDGRIQIKSNECFIFLGFIKNKSEFKILLKQLGIVGNKI